MTTIFYKNGEAKVGPLRGPWLVGHVGMPQVPLSLHQTVSIIEPLRGSSVHTRTSIKRFGGLCIKTSRKVWRLVRAQGHQWGQGGTITGKKLSDILELWKNVLSLQVEFIFTNKNHDI